MGRKGYNPVFAEETFIVNFYGTSQEIEEFELLVAEGDGEPASMPALVDLVETIKRRQFTGMDWRCCHRCQTFLNCSIRRRRAKQIKPQECCSMCKQYKHCLSRFKKQQ